jgi:succinate-acetate transporter protein
MTTIGYGDYSPRTIIGRILIVFISIWGIFTVSMMVVVLSNTFAMNALEKRALNVLKCLAEKVTLKEKAAFIVTLTAKL